MDLSVLVNLEMCILYSVLFKQVNYFALLVPMMYYVVYCCVDRLISCCLSLTYLSFTTAASAQFRSPALYQCITLQTPEWHHQGSYAQSLAHLPCTSRLSDGLCNARSDDCIELTWVLIDSCQGSLA